MEVPELAELHKLADLIVASPSVLMYSHQRLSIENKRIPSVNPRYIKLVLSDRVIYLNDFQLGFLLNFMGWYGQYKYHPYFQHFELGVLGISKKRLREYVKNGYKLPNNY